MTNCLHLYYFLSTVIIIEHGNVGGKIM